MREKGWRKLIQMLSAMAKTHGLGALAVLIAGEKEAVLLLLANIK